MARWKGLPEASGPRCHGGREGGGKREARGNSGSFQAWVTNQASPNSICTSLASEAQASEHRDSGRGVSVQIQAVTAGVAKPVLVGGWGKSRKLPGLSNGAHGGESGASALLTALPVGVSAKPTPVSHPQGVGRGHVCARVPHREERGRTRQDTGKGGGLGLLCPEPVLPSSSPGHASS